VHVQLIRQKDIEINTRLAIVTILLAQSTMLEMIGDFHGSRKAREKLDVIEKRNRLEDPKANKLFS